MSAPSEWIIDRFDDEYRFLSNFSPDPVVYQHIQFPTAEHAFQAAKTTDPNWICRVAEADTPRDAKRIGRRLPLRENWDGIRQQYMLDVVRSKFAPGTETASRLRATADRLLVEGNTWGDDYWGRVPRGRTGTLTGRNKLGRTLMKVRSELLGHEPNRWHRVAVTGHREHLYQPNEKAWVRGELARLAVKLRDWHGTEIVITGMATGADVWWAHAALDAGMRVWAYQPFPEQTARFTRDQQRDHAGILDIAERVIVVGDRFALAHFDTRNALTIDDAEAVVAVRDPRIGTGGTVSALQRYCPGRPVIKVNPATRQTTLADSYTHSRWPVMSSEEPIADGQRAVEAALKPAPGVWHEDHTEIATAASLDPTTRLGTGL